MEDFERRLIDFGALPKNNPYVLRVDMNVPVDKKGKIDVENPRLKSYGQEIKLFSDLGYRLVVVFHQGSPGKRDCIPVNQHRDAVEKIAKRSIEIVGPDKPGKPEDFFCAETKKKIESLNSGDVLFFSNIRFNPMETQKFDPNSSQFVKFFNELNVGGINDAFPAWHRANESIVGTADLYPTTIGFISEAELELLKEYSQPLSNNNMAIFIGGGKVDKASDYAPSLAKIAKIFTGGIPAQVVTKAKGYNLGEFNEAELEKRVGKEVFDIFAELKHRIETPVDFIVKEPDGREESISVSRLYLTKGEIMDIGPRTVEVYHEQLKEYSHIIVGGPGGQWEKGYLNTVELIKRLVDKNILVLGGDSASMLAKTQLLDLLRSIHGDISLGGGAFYHGLVGWPYPYLERLKTRA